MLHKSCGREIDAISSLKKNKLFKSSVGLGARSESRGGGKLRRHHDGTVEIVRDGRVADDCLMITSAFVSLIFCIDLAKMLLCCDDLICSYRTGPFQSQRMIESDQSKTPATKSINFIIIKCHKTSDHNYL